MDKEEKRYRTSGHSRYTIYYHFAFCPKYRKKIFKEIEIDKEIKNVIKQMAPFHDWIIEEMETDQDHIHIFLSAPPRFSPSQIVKLIKTWTYKNMYERYPQMRKYLWGGKMWCEGYYVSTVSDNTTKGEIKRYIQNQKEHERQLGLFE